MDQNISNNMTIASKLVSFFEEVDYKQYKNNSKKQSALVRSLLDIVDTYIKEYDALEVDDSVDKHNVNLELAGRFKKDVGDEIKKFFKDGGNFAGGEENGRELIGKIKNVLDYDNNYKELGFRIPPRNGSPTLWDTETNDWSKGAFALALNSFLSDPVSVIRTYTDTKNTDTDNGTTLDTSALDMPTADGDDPVQQKTVTSTHPSVYSTTKGLSFDLQQSLPSVQDDFLKLGAWERLTGIYTKARLDAKGTYAMLRKRLKDIKNQRHTGIEQILKQINSSNIPTKLGEDAILFYIKKDNLIQYYTPKDSFNPSNPKKSDKEKEYKGDVRDNSLHFVPDDETMDKIRGFEEFLDKYDSLSYKKPTGNEEDPNVYQRLEDAWAAYETSKEKELKKLKKVSIARLKINWLARAAMRLAQDKLGLVLSDMFCESAKAKVRMENELASPELEKELLKEGGELYNKFKEMPEYVKYANLFNFVHNANRGGNSPRQINKGREFKHEPGTTVNRGFTPQQDKFIVGQKSGNPLAPISQIDETPSTFYTLETPEYSDSYMSDDEVSKIIKNYNEEPEKLEPNFVQKSPELVDNNVPNFEKHHDILQKIITDARYAKEFYKKNPEYVKYAVTSVGKSKLRDLNSWDINKIAGDFASMSGSKDNPYNVDTVQYQDGFEKKGGKSVAESILSFLDSL